MTDEGSWTAALPPCRPHNSVPKWRSRIDDLGPESQLIRERFR